MKRSKINSIIKDMENLAKEQGFKLPDFSKWDKEKWSTIGKEYEEIRDNKLGWDITDYGLSNFEKIGFALFTIRNGNYNLKNKYPKPYAEKILMLYEGQTSPLHYHKSKMEDIINRGGNDVYITVYNGNPDLTIQYDTDVEIHMDGKKEFVAPGTKVKLSPGDSITITPYMYHDFQVPESGGPVLLGEVSMCNDDDNDNFFYEKMGRFPTIEEDEPAYRLLCNEYPEFK